MNKIGQGPLYSTSVAAERLGVNPQRIRQLIESGALKAERIGGRWAVSESEILNRSAALPLAGRPYEPRVAWGAIALLSGAKPNWLHASEASRLRRSLSQTTLEEIVPKLRNRAALREYHVHPSALPRLLEESPLLRSGANVRDLSVDWIARNQGDYYVSADDLARVLRKYRPVADLEPNLLLREVPGPWPWLISRGDAPAAAVVADLVEEGSDRARRAGRRLWAEVVAARSFTPLRA